MKIHNHLSKRYNFLIKKAQKSISREASISLLNKADKVRLSMASTEDLEVFYLLRVRDPFLSARIKKNF